MVYPELTAYLRTRDAEREQIREERQRQLDRIARYVEQRLLSGLRARLTFVCTHNSRRSHFAQIWAATAAGFRGVAGVDCYSGGTEATAFEPRAVAALERAGFTVTPRTRGENPVYEVRYGDSELPLAVSSKTIHELPNPSEGFAAVMTCAEADAACPQVSGADLRLSLPYDDPKASDGTPAEGETYDERCRQIAREMLYLFSRVAEAPERGC